MSVSSVADGNPFKPPTIVSAPPTFKPWKPLAPLFQDRLDAGRLLGGKLIETYGQIFNDALFLGCVRGGLVVADGVVDVIRESGISCELDIVVPRKLGLPWNKEFGIGAITEDGTVIFFEDNIKSFNVDTEGPAMIEQIKSEQAELSRRQKEYRADLPPRKMEGRTVVIVDDGIASGLTVSAAVKSVQNLSGNTARIIVAVPVSGKRGEGILINQTQISASDICVFEYSGVKPGYCWSIDDYYVEFNDVEDETVKEILRKQS
jgi:putative phosphoribosyl transferase